MEFRNGDDAAMGLGELELETTEKAAEATPKKAVEMEKKDSGSDSLVIEQAAADAMAEAAKAVAAPVHDSKAVHARRFSIATDPARDELLTDFGKETLNDRYLLPGESYQDLFARVADAYADDQDHAQRLYDYISKLWFMPATPVLSNGGTGRGLPICCYLNSVSDSLEGIVGTWNENVWLASRGGGIGTYWGQVRGIGEPVGLNGKTSGIIPFVRVMDSLTLAISQGSLRRGSAACYLDVSHPEIEEFLEIRKPSGDFNRKALNLHHGVLLSDEFMEAVRDGRIVGSDQPEGRFGPRHGRCPLAVPEAGRNPPRHRRALHRLFRHGEPDDAGAPPRAGPQGLDLQPVLGNHPADRCRPPRQRPHRGVLPVLAQPRDLGRVERGQAVHRGRHALPRQCAAGLYRPRAGGDGARQAIRPCANAASAWA